MAGEIAAMTLVGGVRSFVGPAVGAAVFVFMRDTLSSWTENWLVYFGVIFIAFVMFSPNGIVGVVQRLRGLRRGATAPAPVEALAAAPAPGAPAPVTRDDGRPLLEVDGVTKYFGGLAAVDGASFGVKRGELRSVIGPNGAGKTTLFNVVTGLLAPDGGEARFEGAVITGLPPHRVVARGVSRSFQIISVFQSLSVFENVRLAVQAKHPRRFAMLTDSTRLTDAAAEAARLLQAVGLAEHAGTLAANLSHGDQRLLEIAIALATRPKLLLLDEPLAGLSAPDRVRVAALIREMHCSGAMVPARRRRWPRSRASCRRDAGASPTAGATSPAEPPRPLRARAWAWCRRGGGFFRTSACSRTSPSPVAAGAAGRSSASSRRFPGCTSCATPAAGRCRAASCSCWPSPARSWATSSCCCSTSPSRGSRRRSSRRCGTSCTRSRARPRCCWPNRTPTWRWPWPGAPTSSTTA